MPRRPDLLQRLQRRLACHQALHDRQREPRNDSPWLPRLRQWQAQRLERSFAHYLDDPQRRPAARFFLSDVYGDHDFSRRDADIVRVLPKMQALLPPSLLAAVADAIELGALTHAFDLRMAVVLEALAPRRRTLDEALYANAYRAVGRPRLRRHQIVLIGRVGSGLAQAVRLPGTGLLLKAARLPARAAGLAELQAFLERGYAAFTGLGDVEGFLVEVTRDEAAVSRRLFAGDPAPFASD